MTDGGMIALVDIVASTVAVAWLLAAFMISIRKAFGHPIPPGARLLFHELRPFYLPAIAVGAVITALGDMTWWDPLVIGVQIWNWFGLKDIDDDDDRWKRRRKRLTEAVSQIGSRLVVSPAGAS